MKSCFRQPFACNFFMSGALSMVRAPMFYIAGSKDYFMSSAPHARGNFFDFLRIIKTALQHILDFAFAYH